MPLRRCLIGAKKRKKSLASAGTWRLERALPALRYSQGRRADERQPLHVQQDSPESGVRTFTGSRSASVDATSFQRPRRPNEAG